MGHERHRRLIAEGRENALCLVFLARDDHCVAARNAIEHGVRDVRDQVAERIDFDDFAFDAVRHLLDFGPGYLQEVLQWAA